MGTLPGWITAASTTTGVVTLIVSYWRRGVSLQRLANEDEENIRDHYAQEVQALRGQLLTIEQHYREMLEQSDRRHAECEDARTEIRTELEGLRSQIRLASTDRVLLMEKDPPPAPHARAAAKRVKRIIEGSE